MLLVLDACAAIAMLRAEPGAATVESLINSHKTVIHAVNLCEVYYDFLRVAPRDVALSVAHQLMNAGVEVMDDVSWRLLTIAGDLKVSTRLSLADTFAAALAIIDGGTVLTSDHREFGPVAQRGLCQVHFFR